MGRHRVDLDKDVEDVEPVPVLDEAPISPRSGSRSGRRSSGCWVRQVDAGDRDDGLPGGFLAGALVEVRVALRLNWA